MLNLRLPDRWSKQSISILMFQIQLPVKKVLYLSVNVFSTKVLKLRTICLLLKTGLPFYLIIWAMGKSSHLLGKGSTFILIKILSFRPASGIEPMTFCAAVKCSTDRANPAGRSLLICCKQCLDWENADL